MPNAPSKTNRNLSASAFSPHSYLQKISAYFCFSKAIHWTKHFYFFGSKFKETKVVDAAPLGHLICNSWRVRPEMENYNLAIQVVIIIRVTRLFLSMTGPLPDPDWLEIIIWQIILCYMTFCWFFFISCSAHAELSYFCLILYQSSNKCRLGCHGQRRLPSHSISWNQRLQTTLQYYFALPNRNSLSGHFYPPLESVSRQSISLFCFQTFLYYDWNLLVYLSSSQCEDLGHLDIR